MATTRNGETVLSGESRFPQVLRKFVGYFLFYSLSIRGSLHAKSRPIVGQPLIIPA